MDNVGGVFLVVGVGLVFAIIVGIIDFLWNIRQIAIDEKVCLIQFNQFNKIFQLIHFSLD